MAAEIRISFSNVDMSFFMMFNIKKGDKLWLTNIIYRLHDKLGKFASLDR